MAIPVIVNVWQMIGPSQLDRNTARGGWTQKRRHLTRRKRDAGGDRNYFFISSANFGRRNWPWRFISVSRLY
jgi:hypothetical protein